MDTIDTVCIGSIGNYFMDLQELVQRISMPQDVWGHLQSSLLSDEDFQNSKELFYSDPGGFPEKWLERSEPYRDALPFFLMMAIEVHGRYVEQGISEQVFDDTFRDIAIWAEDFFQKNGYYGIDQIYWIGQSVRMKLFRLGRLQFEPVDLEQDICLDGCTIAAGAKVLNVHIAADGPLLLDDCLDSLQQARDFFNMPQARFICDSWLLAPALEEMLPESSNIIRFQKLFRIISVHHRFRQAEQRVFGRILDDHALYPEETVLQRKLKAALLDGNEPGIGFGIIA